MGGRRRKERVETEKDRAPEEKGTVVRKNHPRVKRSLVTTKRLSSTLTGCTAYAGLSIQLNAEHSNPDRMWNKTSTLLPFKPRSGSPAFSENMIESETDTTAVHNGLAV